MSLAGPAGAGKDGGRRGGPFWARLPKMKLPAAVWRNRPEKEPTDCEEEQQEEQLEEQLEEVSRRLILREEQLFGQDAPCRQAEEDLLLRDLEDLRDRVWTAVHSSFSLSSAQQQGQLSGAVASIQQQEEQDRRWAERPEGRVPPWRPLKWLSAHNTLLEDMVEARLTEACEDQSVGGELSSDIKRQACRSGLRVKEDLLTVALQVSRCYPAHLDILSLYARLYHRSFSARLTQMMLRPPDAHDCCYLLQWVNQHYPQDILGHEDLDGRMEAACLGPLLQQDHWEQLEERYLSQAQASVELWLDRALGREEHSWRSGSAPELIDGYCFSQLACDVIQVMENSLAEVSLAVSDPSKCQRVTDHLESFLCRYTSCLKEALSLNLANVRSVVKAQLVCEQQLRDYVSGTQRLSEQQRRRCVDRLDVLRDCGYQCLTCPIHVQLKMCLSSLWTPGWEDGSLPVVDKLLQFLNEHLADLSDLKPTCRQVVLDLLHEDVVVHYVRKTLKSRKKSREQEVGGAQRVVQDARLMDVFFTEALAGDSWLCSLLCRLAELLGLQDPDSIQLEVVTLSLNFPDFSDDHLVALLSLKSSLSAADVRAIRQSKEQNCPGGESSSGRQFFSRVKVPGIKHKITNKIVALKLVGMQGRRTEVD